MSTLRFITAGESHGKGLLALLEGLPAGLPIDIDAINKDLFRRQQGYGRGGRMKIEKDEVEILAGVRHGQTTGAPVVLWVRNKDWENWKDAMAPEPVPSGQSIAEATVTRPRPGHADLPGALKYGWYDVRNILERSSARETVARVAAGAVAKRLLAEFGVTIISHVIQIGSVAAPSLLATTLGLSRTDYRKSEQNWAGSGEPPGISERPSGSQDTSNLVDDVPRPVDYSSKRSQDSPTTSDDSGSDTYGNPVFLPGLDSIVFQVEASPVRCADPESSRRMVAEIDRAAANGDSLGGIFEVIVTGLPPGLGSHVEWDRRIDGRLAQALMSIQAIKGVEIGEGFALASRFGSSVHDEIYYDGAQGFYRLTNHAGGVEGGITNGEPLIIRAAMKPIPTLRRPLHSTDTVSKEERPAAVERSDICAVPAAAVVGEAMTALILAGAWLEKFGGDSLVETRRNYEGYLQQLRRY